MRRIVALLAPYRLRVALAFALGVGMVWLTTLVPAITGRIVDALGAGRGEAVGREVALLLAVALARAALTGLRRNTAGRVGTDVEAGLRNRLAGHLLALEAGWHDQAQTGQLLSRATSDIRSVRYFLSWGLPFILLDSLTGVIVVARMWLASPRLALVALVVAPPLVVAAVRYNRRLHRVYWRVQQETGELTTVVEENAAGVRVVKAFGREAEELRKLTSEARDIHDANLEAARLRGLYAPLLATLPQLSVALILLYGGGLVVAGGLSLGTLVEFNLYLLLLAAPLQSLGMLFGFAQRAAASAQRVFEVLDRPPGIADAPGSGRLPAPAASGPYGVAVRLEAVTFRYAGAPGPSLDAVDLAIPPGGRVALVGGTGSGKSSLVGLLPRLYAPEAGRVLLDGLDVAGVGLDSLRAAVAVVHQEPRLFSASLRDNVALGRPGIDDRRVVAALAAAGASDLLRWLPEGLDTVVGEQGLRLSGGQRQRVAVARALVARPRLLILDDALSHVDVTTEARILAGLGEAIGRATVLIVATRPAALRLADRVVLLDQGRVVAEGGHDELLRSQPRYRKVLSHNQAAVDGLVEVAAADRARPTGAGGIR
jgi:ABC-type multidrug transport system fused ATPase/permease subunit